MSVITIDMVEEFARFHNISLGNGENFPGVIGSLRLWEQGQGEMQSGLDQEIFAPLTEAYNKAHGVPVEEAPVEEVPVEEAPAEEGELLA